MIDNIPDGDFQAKTKAVLKLPKGEYYSTVETARGEFGVYIISEGGMTRIVSSSVRRDFEFVGLGSYGPRIKDRGYGMAIMGTLIW